MTLDEIKTAAIAAGLAAAIVGNEVHVGCTGLAGVVFTDSIIENGATYLGAIAGRMTPLGTPILANTVVRRFTA